MSAARAATTLRPLLVCALVALTAVAARSAGSDDAPAGLIRSGSTLAKVHALYARARGRERLHSGAVIEEWRLLQDHLSGTYRVRRFGRDERATTVLGPLTYETGVRNGVYWQQNRNGITYTYGGFHEQREAISTHLWDAGSDDRYVRLAGESVPLNAYVVLVAPPDGRREWLYIDKTGGNIIRREEVLRRRRFVTTYDDYRTFDGIPEPSHVRTVDSFGNERDLTLVSRTLDLASEGREVEIPPSRRTLVEFPAGSNLVRLPVRVVNGLLVTRVTIGARPYEFLLDSGAAGIIVDPQIVEDAGVPRLGARVGATLGTFSETTSIVPQIAVGGLRMHNVVVRVVSVPFDADEHTHISGLLGFDFFADTLVRVDVERGQVDAYAPGTPARPTDAVTIPLALDDKTADVRTRVGGTMGRIVLDTGANRSLFTQAFAARFDGVPGPAATTRFRGMGGTGTAERVSLKSFELAGFVLTDVTVDVSAADFDAEDVDGTAGTDLLRAFELTFDYRSNAVYVRRMRRTAGGP